MKLARALALLLATSVSVAACDSSTKSSASSTDAGSTADGASADGTPTVVNTLLKDGDYYLGIYAKPFDLKLNFKVHVVASGSLAAGGSLKSFEMRAITSDGSTTDPIFTKTDVPVAAGGAFDFDIPKVVLPGKASPTGTDVPLHLILKGTIAAGDTFCGSVAGEVPDFQQDLKGSTFKGVPYGTEKKPVAETSCEGDVVKVYAPIAKCPAVQVGQNTMVSAERTRTFQVVLPDAGTPTEATPVVFLFHGVGGSATGIQQDTQFPKLLKTEKFILVVPDSERDAKGVAVLKTDWNYAAPHYDLDNPDLVFFDDLRKCVGEAFPLDANRVYVTGMSGGGLMSTFTGLHRGKVVAAAAPFSGGYLQSVEYPKDEQKTPYMVTWGGPTDAAFSQNFDTLAKALIQHLLSASHPVVQCEHTTGHKWPLELTPAAWTFLKAYELGKPADPWANGLPDVFPKYCKVATK